MVKRIDDVKTMELPGVPVKRPRGRPPTGEAKSSAERMAALRARKLESGLMPVTVNLPVEVVTALKAFVQFKDLNIDAVIEKAVRQAILRKR